MKSLRCAGAWGWFVAVLGASAALAATAAPAAPAAKPEAQQGVVTQVIDGDTLRFQVAGQPAIEVRLAQIDAPEICQPGGAEAKQALAELALNKPAVLRASGRDRQGRSVGVVMVDGASVGQRLVQEGQAWSLVGRNGRGPLVKEERMAQALNRGLHAGRGAVKPDDFLRSHGPCK